MAYTSDIERLNYYEGEYLGALDFASEQEYHREMRRRHNVGQHSWGIVCGLDLAQIPNGQTTNGLAQVDVYVQPGMAVDAFGREIVVLSRTQLTGDLFEAYYDPNTNASPRNMYIWIAYHQQLAQLSGDACTRQNTSNPYSRVQESFRLLVTSTLTPVPSLNDSLIIDSTAMTPPAEPAVPPSPAPTPTPGDIVLPYDGSVPYQEFPQDDTTANWYVLLGQVLWHPHFQVLLQTAAAASGRQYSGAVAAAIEAPNASLVIQDRMTPSPLPTDPTYSGVSVEVQGPLTVDRLLTALQDLWIYEYGHLNFKQSDGTDGDTPLWMRRFTKATGGADLHIHIGDTADENKRLTVGFGADEANQQIVFDIRSDNNVDIPTGWLNFGAAMRQMLNLWNEEYGIGIQSGTLYFRTANGFCWFKGGVHSDTQSDPGAGGNLQMRLDDQARLYFGAQVRQMLNLWNEEYGIGVQSGTLYFRTATDFCWFRGGSHSDTQSDPGGGTLAMKLDNNNHLDVKGRILRQGQAFSVASSADHNAIVNVPWGTTDDWNIFVSPKVMGEEETDSEADNAVLKIECFASSISTTAWQITAHYKFKYWNDNPRNGVWKSGSANYLLVPK